MNLEEKEFKLVEDYLIIENPMERLAILIERARSLPEFPDSKRKDEYLVPGCSSRAWIIPHPEGDSFSFSSDADAAIIKSLTALLCELYSGSSRGEIAGFHSDIVAKLRLEGHVSPTRQRGLRSFVQAIQSAAGALPS